MKQPIRIGTYTAAIRINGRSYLGTGWTRPEAIRNLQSAILDRCPVLSGMVTGGIDWSKVEVTA